MWGLLAALASTASVLAPAPVGALAADGPRVALAAGCEVRVWTPPARRTSRLGRMSCPRTSTGSGIPAVSIGGRRVLWLHYAGGNIREWSLWTATTTRPTPRRLRFVARDVDAPPPLVLGEADVSRTGDLLPYAVDDTVVALRENGSRALTWRAPARVTALGANAGGLAVAAADGSVTVFDAADPGAPTDRWTGPTPARAVFVTGNGVAAQRGRTLEFRDGSPVTLVHVLPSGARVVDAQGTEALYVHRGRVRRIDVVTGVVRDVAAAAHAQLEPGRLVHAAGRRVVSRAP